MDDDLFRMHLDQLFAETDKLLEEVRHSTPQPVKRRSFSGDLVYKTHENPPIEDVPPPDDNDDLGPFTREQHDIIACVISEVRHQLRQEIAALRSELLAVADQQQVELKNLRGEVPARKRRSK